MGVAITFCSTMLPECQPSKHSDAKWHYRSKSRGWKVRRHQGMIPRWEEEQHWHALACDKHCNGYPFLTMTISNNPIA